MPLSYPPHTCAAACLRLSWFLFTPSASSKNGPEAGRENEVLEEKEIGEEWSEKCQSRDQDLDGTKTFSLSPLFSSLCPSRLFLLPPTREANFSYTEKLLYRNRSNSPQPLDLSLSSTSTPRLNLYHLYNPPFPFFLSISTISLRTFSQHSNYGT